MLIDQGLRPESSTLGSGFRVGFRVYGRVQNPKNYKVCRKDGLFFTSDLLHVHRLLDLCFALRM